MIVKSSMPGPDFRPLTLELTFEKEKELVAFYSLFTHLTICNFLRENGIEAENIRAVIISTKGQLDYGAMLRDLVIRLGK